MVTKTGLKSRFTLRQTLFRLNYLLTLTISTVKPDVGHELNLSSTDRKSGQSGGKDRYR